MKNFVKKKIFLLIKEKKGKYFCRGRNYSIKINVAIFVVNKYLNLAVKNQRMLEILY
jgi:hypothetical protein